MTHAEGREGLRRNPTRKENADGRQGTRHDQESIECHGFDANHHCEPLRKERGIVHD